MQGVKCSNCGRPYPEQGTPYRCTVCTGVYDIKQLPDFALASVDLAQPGIWRYRASFGLAELTPQVSLGEGGTPLVWGEVFGRQVAFKLEFCNPTGSFKDRGSAVLLSFLKGRGVQTAVEDSSGNAGASFAAYAARAGIAARVFVPDSSSKAKRRQIELYGAELVHIDGPRSNAAQAVQRAADEGAVYASHAYLPHGLAGYATLAYELFEQLGQAPGAVVLPAGQGNLLLGLGRGFQAMQRGGVISSLPVLLGVQALACAPLWAVFQYGTAGMSWVSEGDSLAEGVRVLHPLHGDAVLVCIREHHGFMTAVAEEKILAGRDELARRGFYVEPTSAIVWDGLEQSLDQLPDPVVVVLTGSGLKFTE